jgi:hypothetical protein
MDDSACTSCHQDLDRHRIPVSDAGPSTSAASAHVPDRDHVMRFDQRHHPEFTPATMALGSNSARIKFSHARHMAKGLTLEDKGIPFRFECLEPTDRARYGGSPDYGIKEPIQLACSSCHQLDSEVYSRGLDRRLASSVPPRTSGDVMLPVTYENHCRACHPLKFEPRESGRQVGHGLEPRRIVDELRQYYASQAVNADPALLKRPIPSRAIPGRPVLPEVVQAQDAVEEKVFTAIKLLFGAAVDESVRKREGLPLARGGCVECHELKSSARPLVDKKAVADLDIRRPVVVRSLWFEAAIFDHAAHRALACAVCHAGASEARDNEVSLLPTIGQCVDCHAPPSTRQGRQRGGAGVACTECHRYHNGDHRGQGVGAPARRGTAEMTLDQFLSGGPRPGR